MRLKDAVATSHASGHRDCGQKHGTRGRLLLVGLVALVLPTCAEEVISVRSNSFASKLAQYDRGGWSVTSNERAAAQQRVSAANSNHANVRVISGVDWSKTTFDTNFKVDDPKIQAELEQRRQQSQPAQPVQQPQQNPAMRPNGPDLMGPANAPSSQPGESLFGPMPVTPGK